MAQIVLFGATGYTGRLTARALASRGADFALAGRNRSKLEALAATVGGPPIHVAETGDIASLVNALDGAKVLITCAGPFMELGETAARAAVEAGVHYVDSTGEGPFIARLYDHFDAAARSADIAMAPAMGFDEVPGDLACTEATEGIERPSLEVTYALPREGSTGTVRSALGIVTSEGTWVEDGVRKPIRAGASTRWAPMPHPLGPRRAASFPLAIGELAPRHLDIQDFRCYVTAGGPERALMKMGVPVLRTLLAGPARPLIYRAVGGDGQGPSDEGRAAGKWTILAEASGGSAWRNVVVSGSDPYGLTAHMLTAAGLEMASEGYDKKGVLSPVQAFGAERVRSELEDFGVVIDTYAPV
jgi:short subunit dehydrogenase-like uncharacterized protein